MGKIWTLWLPLAALAAQLLMEKTFSGNEKAVLMSENGPVELLQFFVIAGAFCVAAVTLAIRRVRQTPWLLVWVAVAALACFYVAGEEISWGQHFLNWSTPEYWQSVNDQHETNLHNTSAWLDQKPRLILFLGIVVGGLIFPAMQRFRPGRLPEKFTFIYPPASLCLVAGLVLGPYLAQEIAEHFFHAGIFQRVSEVQELYMFYFVLLYMIVLRGRVSG